MGENKNSIFVIPSTKNKLIENAFVETLAGSSLSAGDVLTYGNSKACSIDDNILHLAPATFETPGILSTEYQNIKGVKNFTDSQIEFDGWPIGVTGGHQYYFGIEALKNSIISPDNNKNIAFGSFALQKLTTGINNISIGIDSSILGTVGSNNITLGASVCRVSSADNCIALGTSALEYGSKTNTIALGKNTLNASTSTDNIAIGHNIAVDNEETLENSIVIGHDIIANGVGTFNKNIIIGSNSKMQGGNNILLGHDVNSGDSVNTNTINFCTSGISRMKFDGANWNFGNSKYPASSGITGAALINTSNGVTNWGYAGGFTNNLLVISNVDYTVTPAYDNIVIKNAAVAAIIVNFIGINGKSYNIRGFQGNAAIIGLDEALNPVLIDESDDPVNLTSGQFLTMSFIAGGFYRMSAGSF